MSDKFTQAILVAFSSKNSKFCFLFLLMFIENYDLCFLTHQTFGRPSCLSVIDKFNMTINTLAEVDVGKSLEELRGIFGVLNPG
ncbi:MAG: hypothetical protein O3A59_09110 [Nitrospirae bacterium]|nr:hypothetical protein [Nitrospirota bacterium]